MWRPYLAARAEHWQAILALLLAPISWIPDVQREILAFLFGPPGWAVVPKVVLLLPPTLLFLWALWCTAVATYTFLFRAHRRHFGAAMLVAWWDGARMVWGYWLGLARFAYVAIGWAITLARLVLRLVVETVRRLFVVPVVAGVRLTGRYFRPGLPWLAMLLLIGWATLEASVFTHVLYPAVWDVLETAVGVRAPMGTGPALFILLVVLVLGSFACVDALRESIERRRRGAIATRAAVLVMVTGFEVAFLYRPLVEMVAPRIGQRAGTALGLPAILALAAFGWIAVRGAAWFLFGRFGAQPMAALVSRRPMDAAAGPATQAPGSEAPVPGSSFTLDVREEINWLRSRAREELEALTLPVVQLLAAAVNMAVVVLTSRPVFSLPLRGMAEVTAGRELLDRLGLRPRRDDLPPAPRPPDEAETAPVGRYSGWRR